MEMLLHAADSLTAACEAKWMLVDEAVGAGRLPFCKAPGAFYLIAKRAARLAGTYKDFLAKLPRNFYYRVPDFYVAAPLPVELIHTIMQFADGRTLARFSSCSPHLRVRAEKIASERLARITTLRLGQPAVADWKTNTRLLGVVTNPPGLRSLLGPGTAWAPIRDHVKEHWPPYLSKNMEPTDYGREDDRAAMVMWALRLGDAALIEGVMRMTDPSERSKLPRHHFYSARGTYLITSADSPAWCSYIAITSHFLNVEQVQAAAAANRSISEYTPLLQSAAEHDRYFPGLHRTNQDSTWGRWLSYVR